MAFAWSFAAAPAPSRHTPFPNKPYKYEFITKERGITIFNPREFEGIEDVVMKDAEDDTDSMDFEADVVAVPEEFKCCITMAVMNDPFIDTNDGRSYERGAILQWLKNSRTSPATRQPLRGHQLKPNDKLREKIRDFRANHPNLELD